MTQPARATYREADDSPPSDSRSPRAAGDDGQPCPRRRRLAACEPPPVAGRRVVDGLDAGAIGRDSAARAFPDRALPLRRDRRGRYDQGGERRTTARSNGFGSLTYMLYGVADRLTVGLIPTAGFNTVSGAPSSSSVGLGDLTLHAEYGLTRFHQGRWVPATAIVVQEGLPTGKVRSARRSPDRRPRHRRAHDDAGVLLTDVLLAAERPHPAHARRRLPIVFAERERPGRQRLWHGNRLSRTRRARRLVPRRWIVGVQPEAELGARAGRHVPPRRIHPRERIPDSSAGWRARRDRRQPGFRLQRSARLRAGDRIQLDAEPGRDSSAPA